MGYSTGDDMKFPWDGPHNPHRNPCWLSGFSFELCCRNHEGRVIPPGNLQCWEGKYSWTVCCEGEAELRESEPISQSCPSNGSSTQRARSKGSACESSPRVLESRFVDAEVVVETNLRCLRAFQEDYVSYMRHSSPSVVLTSTERLGDPQGCFSFGFRYFWVVTNQMHIGFCVPQACDLNKHILALDTLVVVWMMSLEDRRIGCFKQMRDMGMLQRFPNTYVRRPTDQEQIVLRGCERPWRHYFPTRDTADLVSFLRENDQEIRDRLADLHELKVTEYKDEISWQPHQLPEFLILWVGIPVLCTACLLLRRLSLSLWRNTVGCRATLTSAPRARAGCGLAVLGDVAQKWVLRPFSLQEAWNAFIAPGSDMNLGVCRLRVCMCLAVIFLHTAEAFQWECSDAWGPFLERGHWWIYGLAHCLHRVNTLFTALSSCLMLESIHRDKPSTRAGGKYQHQPRFEAVTEALTAFVRQALLRWSRQTPLMLFYCWCVIRVVGYPGTVPFRPMSTTGVWYDHRPKVCGRSYRWLSSSFFVHSLHSGKFHAESVCHNTAIFEAEFQVTMCCAALVLAGNLLHKFGYTMSGSKTSFWWAQLTVLIGMLCCQCAEVMRFNTSSERVRWSEDPALERSARTLPYWSADLLCVPLLILMFDMLRPPPGFAPQRAVLSWRSVLFTPSCVWASVAGALVLIIDFSVFVVGKYPLFAEYSLHVGGGYCSGFFVVLSKVGSYVNSALRDRYLFGEAVLLDFALDFPATFGLWHLIRNLLETDRIRNGVNVFQSADSDGDGGVKHDSRGRRRASRHPRSMPAENIKTITFWRTCVAV
ncbi:unnamed protein product [Prorocentrum cordatum]|uniref:Uncharacterized protein n=1 Tax=Prorocentrum cordatum TaxID=2364126 RepID=A0ABN9RD64_9DINO|nr:unnamed protein product [Polarella glacialis]